MRGWIEHFSSKRQLKGLNVSESNLLTQKGNLHIPWLSPSEAAAVE